MVGIVVGEVEEEQGVEDGLGAVGAVAGHVVDGVGVEHVVRLVGDFLDEWCESSDGNDLVEMAENVADTRHVNGETVGDGVEYTCIVLAEPKRNKSNEEEANGNDAECGCAQGFATGRPPRRENGADADGEMPRGNVEVLEAPAESPNDWVGV